jgi:hypothetical protein
MGDLHHANKVRLYNALPFCGIEFLERSIRSEIPGIIDENVDQFAPQIQTSAPLLASSCEIARPMPLAPPVTMAVWLAKSNVTGMSAL